MTTKEQLLVNHQEAAALLGVSHVTLLKLRRAGEIPFLLIGNGPKSVRYSVASLNMWIQGRSKKGRPAK